MVTSDHPDFAALQAQYNALQQNPKPSTLVASDGTTYRVIDDSAGLRFIPQPHLSNITASYNRSSVPRQ